MKAQPEVMCLLDLRIRLNNCPRGPHSAYSQGIDVWCSGLVSPRIQELPAYPRPSSGRSEPMNFCGRLALR